MDVSTISLTFRYTETDYVRALRAHYASRLRLWLDICVIVVGVIVGVYSWPGVGWLSIASFGVTGASSFSTQPSSRCSWLSTPWSRQKAAIVRLGYDEPKGLR